MVNNPIFVDLGDYAEDLAELTEVFDPAETDLFMFDAGYYSALRSRDVEPDQYDRDRLIVLKALWTKHFGGEDNG